MRSLSDVTVGQWQKIYEVICSPSENEIDRFDQSLKVIGIIHGLTDGEIDSISTDDLKKYLPTLNILSEPMRRELPRSVRVNGRKYKFIYNPAKLPTHSALKLSQMEFNSPGEIVHRLPEIVALMTSNPSEIAIEDVKDMRFGQAYSIFLFNLKAIMALAKKTSPEVAEILKSINPN